MSDATAFPERSSFTGLVKSVTEPTRTSSIALLA